MTPIYSESFYADRLAGARSSASVIAPLVLQNVSVTSVVDVGCGLGTWLSAFAAHGVEDIFGLDGDYVVREQLEIPVEKFQAANLAQSIALGRRFDLAICLEVAEHLPDASASALVGSLTSMADVILFSAAPPGQGGTNHVNEQWPAYWAQLFDARGFQAFDVLRPIVWDDPSVDWWYAQNSVLYANAAGLAANPALLTPSRQPGWPPSLVHPRSLHRVLGILSAYAEHREIPGLRWCLRAAALSVRNVILRRLPRQLRPAI